MKIRRFFLLLAALIVGVFAATGCQKRDLATEDDNTVKIDLAQTTAQHKLDAYERFEAKGGKMDAFGIAMPEGTLFDLLAFTETLGLNYEVNEKTIIITPNVPYEPSDDFKYVINIDDDMVRGHDMYVGNLGGENWTVSEHYDSATDCIFQMVLAKQVYDIGADEFDQMYRNLRVLTTPLEKVREVNEAIDAELSYSE